MKYKDNKIQVTLRNQASTSTGLDTYQVIEFIPWQPSTWPISLTVSQLPIIMGTIFKETMIGEIGNVINDIVTNNGSL